MAETRVREYVRRENGREKGRQMEHHKRKSRSSTSEEVNRHETVGWSDRRAKPLLFLQLNRSLTNELDTLRISMVE